MTIRIVRLGSPRSADEGLRIGTVRRPPRGVPKQDLASRDFYDVWLPLLAPSEALLKRASGKLNAESGSDREWRAFSRAYLKEMKASEPARTLEVLAALSHQTNFSLGCYCKDESHCHRSLLRKLLEDRGAAVQ